MKRSNLIVKVATFAALLSTAQCFPAKVAAQAEITSQASTTEVVRVESKKERKRRLSEATKLEGQVETRSLDEQEAKRSRIKPGYDNKSDLNFGMHPSWMLVI